MSRARGQERPRGAGLWRICVLAIVVATVPTRVAAQPVSPPAPRPQPEAAAAPPGDPLGRETPRGAIFGFLNAARKGETELARQYLDTPLTGKAGEALAQQLFVVLDARLPARLTQISDVAEGSRSNPLKPDQEIIGAIRTSQGEVEIALERIAPGRAAPVWLFSKATLESVPKLYAEVTSGQDHRFMPRFLTGARVRGVRLIEWLSVLFAIPILYVAIAVIDRAFVPLKRFFRSRSGMPTADRHVLPRPVRVLLAALAGRWLLATSPLSLLVRQFWANVASLVTIVAVVWILIHLAAVLERYISRHIAHANAGAATSLLRLGRRAIELLIVFSGVLATLRHFGIDATPALAGLGVGGIAVALAAQKTLENVIAGASLIFDQAVRVGDVLKMGDVVGTVDQIGLRSTRIRTLDRTIVSVPNGQIANASLETMSARDKYWFHPVVALGCETEPESLHAVLDGIRTLLARHPAVDAKSVSARLVRVGPLSLDVEIYAYLSARDWSQFLEMQEQLLFEVTALVRRTGARIAVPWQARPAGNGQTPVAAVESRSSR